MPATRLPPLLCRRTMAALRELVFVKNCSPSLASKLPSTITSAGLAKPVDSTEMLAAYAEPADNAAQASARDRNEFLPLLWSGSELGTHRTPRGRKRTSLATVRGHSMASSGASRREFVGAFSWDAGGCYRTSTGIDPASLPEMIQPL